MGNDVTASGPALRFVFHMGYTINIKASNMFAFAKALLYVDVSEPLLWGPLPHTSWFPGFPCETRDFMMIELMTWLNSDPMFLLTLKSFESDRRGEGSEIGESR